MDGLIKKKNKKKAQTSVCVTYRNVRVSCSRSKPHHVWCDHGTAESGTVCLKLKFDADRSTLLYILLPVCGEMLKDPCKHFLAGNTFTLSDTWGWTWTRGSAQSSVLLWVLKACFRRWASISSWKTSIPRWECEASFMALDWMHMRYCSGVSSSAHCFSCHIWKRSDTGVRITISSLRRYFLYRWTSSTPQPFTSKSNPPVWLGHAGFFRP